MLVTSSEVKKLLASGKTLIVAGEESLLRELPRGNWIGGTIPYFMTDQGGVTSRDHIFVQQVPDYALKSSIRTYDVSDIDQIGKHSPDCGYTVVIIPAFSELHQSYALNAPIYPELFLKVIAGWVAGVHLDDLRVKTPYVFYGMTGEASNTKAVALHIELPADYAATLSIVNIFEPDAANEITFPESGFRATSCTINGQKQNFHDYLATNKVDVRFPLIAESYGTLINVSIQTLDADRHRVNFSAPVFSGVTYRFAKTFTDYEHRFAVAVPKNGVHAEFSCNCYLNYLYGKLEGHHTGDIKGPMTFGEIAYQLLNQTMVYVAVERVKPIFS